MYEHAGIIILDNSCDVGPTISSHLVTSSDGDTCRCFSLPYGYKPYRSIVWCLQDVMFHSMTSCYCENIPEMDICTCLDPEFKSFKPPNNVLALVLWNIINIDTNFGCSKKPLMDRQIHQLYNVPLFCCPAMRSMSPLCISAPSGRTDRRLSVADEAPWEEE